MIPYNIELQLEGDTDRIGNYYINNLQFPFPDDPIIKARELECNRFKRVIRKYNNRLLQVSNNRWLIITNQKRRVNEYISRKNNGTKSSVC